MIEWEYDDYRKQKYPVVRCDKCEEYETIFYKYGGQYLCKDCLLEELEKDEVIKVMSDFEVVEDCE